MRRLARHLAALLTAAGVCLMTGGVDGRLGTYMLSMPQTERMKNVTVLSASPAYTRPAPGPLVVHGHDVHGNLTLCHVQHGLEDFPVLWLIEILRGQHLDGLEHSDAVLQHGAEDGALDLRAGGRDHALEFRHRDPPSSAWI